MPAKNADRRHDYWAMHDFSTGCGLEIGPLHRTIVPRDEADVRYVDVADQAGLRAHYGPDTGVDPALIPEIDYVLLREDGSARSLLEATAEGAPFAWVVASHVIEHVPDVIGWLGELAEITEDDGVLVLAVPDRRFCFDVNRPPTTVGQMIQAHKAGDTRPSVRAVYDYFTSVVDNTSPDLWAGRTPDYSRRLYSLKQADEKVVATETGEYVDCHVWLFTPQSFVEQMHELRLTDRSDWFIDAITETPAHDVEFRVRMRRLPRATDTTAAVIGEVTPAMDRPDWLTPVEAAPLVAHLEQRVVELEERLARSRSTLKKIRARRAANKRTITGLRRELAEVRGSRQWHAGELVLRPLRAVNRRRRG